MNNWPKHDDGRDKKMGEMTRQERAHVLYSSKMPYIIEELETSLRRISEADKSSSIEWAISEARKSLSALALARGEG